MSLFKSETRSFYGDPTYNPFERPSMPLASLALDGVLGSGTGDAGVNVDPLAGLAIPTAFRCIGIISTVFASCTVETISKSGDAERWDVLDNLVSYTAFEIMEIVAAHIAGWGNFCGRKILLNGRLVDLQPIFPGDVAIIRKRGKKIFRVKKRDDDGQAITNPSQPNMGVYEDLTEDQVFHIPGFGYDGLKGVSPILLAGQMFGTTIAADRLAGRFYRTGQQLGGIINVKAPLANQDQADAIKHNWHANHSGVNNSGNIAVLDAETTFTPITIAPEALQFLQSRQWQASEVAKMFGIPPFMISEQTTWGTGIEQQWQGFVTMTLRSYTDRTEQRFTREFLPRGKLAEFDLDRLMRGSMAERYAAYGQGIGWGWMTRNEARIKERMKKLPGLDAPLEPTTMNGALADGPMMPGNTAGAANSKTAPVDPNAPDPTAPVDPKDNKK